MPVRSSTPVIHVVVHRTAGSFLSAAWTWLFSRESAANMILPYALERLALERGDANTHALTLSRHACLADASNQRAIPDTSTAYSPSDCLWLTCWSTRQGEAPHLDLILTCTDGTLGPYPIFLWSSLAPSQTTREHLDPRIAVLVDRFSGIVPFTRVFSVFGPTSLTKNFSRQWSRITDMKPVFQPFYEARLLYATSETLTAPSTMPSDDCVRLATPYDIMAAGQLCKEFAELSVYYPLTFEAGVQEATELIRNRQLWVYETDRGRIASLAAVARISPNVATITKVYTGIAYRERRYAERLVRMVTWEMLHGMGKKRVVLYVGNGNAAAKVYVRVGFLGVQGQVKLEDIDEWLEIGFHGVSRGHW